jgi:FkbM family methyltransferase
VSKDDIPFQPYVTNIDIDGVKFKFKIFTKEAQEQHDRKPGQPMYRDDLKVGFYGYEQFQFIRDRLIQPGDTIFDVGGEYGFTTSLFSLWTGKVGRVLTIEAHPWMANLIKQNVRLNSLDNVKVVNKAAASKDGDTVNFDGSFVSTGNSGLKVETARLDQFADLFPDLVKIDIEGYEVEALKGASRLIAQTPKLCVELHASMLPSYGSTVEEFFGLLPCDRYTFYIQWGGDQTEVVPFDPPTEMGKIEGVVQIYAIPKEIRHRSTSLLTKLRRMWYWM